MVVVRILQTSHISCWDTDGDPIWLSPGEIPGDMLAHFVAQKNALSVFILTSGEGESDLRRLVAAFAAGRKGLEVVDLATIDAERLTEVGFTLVESPGELPDATVSGWHRDISQLSASSVLRLALCFRNAGARTRFGVRRVAELIAAGVAASQINIDSLRPRLIDDLAKRNVTLSASSNKS